jgi:hypothetical protein
MIRPGSCFVHTCLSIASVATANVASLRIHRIHLHIAEIDPRSGRQYDPGQIIIATDKVIRSDYVAL